MTDAELLFLILAGFYLGECAFWVRTGMFVFSSQLGGKRRRQVDLRFAMLRNPEGGVLLGNLLPLGQASLTQQWPLSLSPHGVYGFVSQAWSRDGRPRQPERFIRYQDIESVEGHGHRLLVNGVLFAHTIPTCAGGWAALIRRLAALPETERGKAIDEALARHLNAAAIKERLALFRRLAADLTITCSVLFFTVFVLPPLLVIFDSPFPLYVLLICYAGLVFLAIFQFREAHRTLYPQEKWERRRHMLMMLLSPADVVHARDKLGRHLLGDYSPLAVAKVVCSPVRFAEFAAAAWRDMEFPMLPICPAPDDSPRETEAWFRNQLRLRLVQFLGEAGVPLDDVVKPPAPEHPSSRTFCPRCLGQFVLSAGTCADCGGRPLQSFPLEMSKPDCPGHPIS
jgi:hypothetical protein